MPWNESYFPHQMLNLAPAVRDNAIHIANALLAQGYPEGMAIRIAISQAKGWAAVWTSRTARASIGQASDRSVG